MSINAASLDLIMRSEGWVNHAYPDPGTGGEPLTIGYGHTSAAGPPAVVAGMTITLAQGSVILQNDLEKVETNVRSLVTVPLTNNQLGALVSFTFNLGVGNLKSSTLLKLLNAGNYSGAANEFGKWINAAGKPMAGLVKRRAAEKALFLTPDGQDVNTPETPPAVKSQGFLANLIASIIRWATNRQP